MRLMISVTSDEEAREAVMSGADLLDVKNPEEGSLGAQPPGVIRKIRTTCMPGIQISAAIGDMPNLPGTAALAALGAAGCGVDYIKIGLYGTSDIAAAIRLLRQVEESVREFGTAVIAASYADHQRVGSLDPRHLPEVSAAAQIQGCLIDTAVKDGRSLLEIIPAGTLESLVLQTHRAGLMLGCAGALREHDLPVLKDLGADIAGVRSAVCRNRSRTQPLDPNLVRNLIAQLR